MKQVNFSLVLGVVFTAIAVFSFSSGNAQTVKIDSNGNYYAAPSTTVVVAKQTGKTFTDAKGKTYPVFISKNGKLFIVRTSKTGKYYNQYLKF